MSQTAGMQGERLDAIRSHLYAHGFSTIQSLADSVGASLATIRRDLQVLERESSIDRVHGGVTSELAEEITGLPMCSLIDREEYVQRLAGWLAAEETYSAEPVYAFIN